MGGMMMPVGDKRFRQIAHPAGLCGFAAIRSFTASPVRLAHAALNHLVFNCDIPMVPAWI
jgi:hypothetical protein